jgi:hypothetical protein
VATTILGETIVETLVELRELQRLYDAPLPCAETESIAERLAEQEGMIDYLHRRFAELNRSYLESPPKERATGQAKSEAPIDVGRIRAEVAGMDDRSLFRYGSVLKYICVVEARLLDLPLEASEALLQEVRAEWRRRFGDQLTAESL